ncbi:MAG: alanyl-tRNA editing protein [Parvularculaceae bacterium]
MTEPLYVEDAYLNACEAKIVAVNDRGGIVLDRTVFYPTGGGQPGDRGRIAATSGLEIAIATTVKGAAPGEIVHVPAEGEAEKLARLAPGDAVRAEIDWDYRYALMRMHTAMHVLSAALPYPVTGGQVGAEKSRLDFLLPDPPAKEEATETLNALIAGDHPVASEWISDEELAANPDLVKTMSVKPPSGAGRVRLIRVGEIDLQPCGGTHVKNTSEIGPVSVAKIESKGKQNRRVAIKFAE